MGKARISSSTRMSCACRSDEKSARSRVECPKVKMVATDRFYWIPEQLFTMAGRMHPLLLETAHRPIPMPSGSWSMKQTWHDLLFAHWPLAPQKLRALVPQELELDLRDGMAYVAVAPFWMSGIRGRLAPPLPFLYKFCELNVRTYVRYNGVPGVYFFSLDAASFPAVIGARATYKLPYFHAAMLIRSAGQSFEYTSTRLQMPRPADFHAHYAPTSLPR